MNLLLKLITVKQYLKSKFNSNFNLGKKVRFRKFFLISGTGKIEIGNDVFFNNNVSLNVLGTLKIGDNVLFGENVKLYDHDHRYGGFPFSINKHEFTVKNVSIGNNVWIGSGTIILKGTTIEDNVIVGAGSVVSGTILKNTKFIQKRINYSTTLGNDEL